MTNVKNIALNANQFFQLYKSELIKGDTLFYFDNDNCEKWRVLEVDIEFNCFTVKGFWPNDEITKVLYFEELQYGWEFSNRTTIRIKNTL